MAFTGKDANEYNVNLNFTDADPDGNLKKFIRVKILSGETELYDELLTDAMEGKTLNLRVNFSKSENTELKGDNVNSEDGALTTAATITINI